MFQHFKSLLTSVLLCSVALSMPPKKGKMSKTEEDAFLNQTMEAVQSQRTETKLPEPKQTSPIATKKQIEEALDNFLMFCNPVSPTITKTGLVITSSKACTKKMLDQTLKNAIALNLTAVESLCTVCEQSQVKVNGSYSLAVNFGVVYNELLEVSNNSAWELPLNFLLALRNPLDINNTTCDSRFIRILDILKKDYSVYATLIEQRYYSTSIDGTPITPENKLHIMANLYFKQIQKQDCSEIEKRRSLYMLANFIFKNGLSDHPDNKTDLRTFQKRVQIAAKMYFDIEEYGELADCLMFLDYHPDKKIDISTRSKKGNEILKLYSLALAKNNKRFITAREGIEKEGLIERSKQFYNNMGSTIMRYHPTIDPETNKEITNRIQIAAQYFWKSESKVSIDFLTSVILSGELRYHPATGDLIEDPDLLAFSLLQNQERDSESMMTLLKNGERIAYKSSIDVTQNYNLCLWRLIAKEHINHLNGKKLKSIADRINAIEENFLTMRDDDQSNPRVHFGLGLAYLELKEYQKAKRKFQIALDAGFDALKNLKYCDEQIEMQEEIPLVKEDTASSFPQQQHETQSAETVEEKKRIIALKKQEQYEKCQEEALAPQRFIERYSREIPFKIVVNRIDTPDNIQKQKDDMEKILPGKVDKIIEEIKETGWPRGSKPLGRYEHFDNQLLIEVKMNDEHRLFYTRNNDGIVTIHKIGGHTPTK